MDEKDNIPENDNKQMSETPENAQVAVEEENVTPHNIQVEENHTESEGSEQAAGASTGSDTPDTAKPETHTPAPVTDTPSEEQPAQAPAEQAVYTTAATPMQPAQTPSPTGALVCGILAIVFCFIPIAGIALGIVAIVLAGKYFKSGGSAGQGTAGRICGIIGIVLSIVMIIISAITVFTAYQLIDDYSSTSVRSNALQNGTASGALSSSHHSTAEMSEEEVAIDELVSAKLQLIKDQDPASMSEIAAAASNSFSSAFSRMGLDLTLQDCGVDPAVFAAKMVDGFDFEPYYVDIDSDGTEAEANYEITARDITEVLNILNDKLDAAMEDGSINSMDYEQLKSHIGTMIMDSVSEASITSGNIWDVDVDLIGGNWIIDQESWDDELDYFFGFM